MCGPLLRLREAGLFGMLLLAAGATAQEATYERDMEQRGVITVIPADVNAEETFSNPVPLVEIVRGIPNLEWSPNYEHRGDTLLEKSKRVIMRRPVWTVEFSFKPMRMLEVDVPQSSGKMQRKLIWYMVYRVRNNGYDLNPAARKDRWGHTMYDVEDVNLKSRPLLGRFVLFPHFVLHSLEFDKEYLDRVIPAAQQAIQDREDPGRKLGPKLYNTVEISRVELPLSDERVDRSVWGVVMWEDVDPRIDYFSVFARGLTNAYIFQDPQGGYQPGAEPGAGRVFLYKTLQLNFWRPGDSVLEHEREIRFGVPIDPEPTIQQEILDRFGLREPLDHLWVYR